ncbi:hypothetical protein [Marinobacterium rhizophilum]|uniref:hypothetical protein n=1 Tax=Marinobacterium rhizophilum TaxID=420402 RepID=UPI00037D8472|nr:hypothetical protein [Marinobacterium rhizophilum]
MARGAIKIDLYLYEVLVEKNFDCFTMSELRDAYMQESDIYTIADRESLKNWLYGQLNRLIKNRIVVKLNEHSIERPIYVKTDLFYYTTFNIDGHIINPIKAVKIIDKTIAKQSAIDELKNCAKQYRVDFMTSLAESEEYMRIIKTFPDLTPRLKEQYHRSRVNSTKLLGKLKAVEVLLTEWSCYEA